MKTSVSFLGVLYIIEILWHWFLFCFSICLEVLSSEYLFTETSLYWTSLGQWNEEKHPPIRDRECFDWNLFLSPAARYCIITTCSMFWKTEIIVSWLFFLLLDSLSENNLVSKNMDLLKNNVGNKLTWKFERFGKCIKRITYLGIILPDAQLEGRGLPCSFSKKECPNLEKNHLWVKFLI